MCVDGIDLEDVEPTRFHAFNLCELAVLERYLSDCEPDDECSKLEGEDSVETTLIEEIDSERDRRDDLVSYALLKLAEAQR